MKRFPSIKSNRDYQLVYNKGKSYGNKFLVMYTLKKSEEGNRIGISVSKKVGNSVVRHRMARLIRESFRLNSWKLSSGYDIVVVVRAAAAYAGFSDIERAYLHLCNLHGLIEKNN